MAKIIGWIMTVLAVVFLGVVSAGGKFSDWEGKEEMFAKFGFTVEGMKTIGIVEVVVAVMLLIPQTAFLGAILMTGYLGGALCVHLREGEPFWFPIVISVFIWVAVALRMPEIFRLAFGIPVGKPTIEAKES